eukprot:CFRG5751T1
MSEYYQERSERGYGGAEGTDGRYGGGWGGGGRRGGGGQNDYMSEAIREERRLKRSRLCEKYVSGVWARSPSPPAWAKRDMRKQKEEGGGRKEKIEIGKLKAAVIAAEVAKKLSKKDENDKKSESESGSNSASESEHSADEEEWIEASDEDSSKPKGDEIIGPVMAEKGSQVRLKAGYDKHMLAGEADAMAAFIDEGMRIPRRGEIGLRSDEITAFEAEGYVMSGSRHRRMEAVRLRKENQVYTADERRALAMFNYEEKKKKENALLTEFRSQVNSKLKDKEIRDAHE